MKKNVLRFALVGFLFVGLSLLGAGQNVQSQTLSSSVFSPATGVPLVGKEEALLRLDAVIVPHKNIMEAFPPHAIEHKQALRKYTYFNSMINLIVNGTTVPVAIGEALKFLVSDEYSTPDKLLGALKQEAIIMLKP